LSRDAATPEKKALMRGVLVLIPAALFAKIVGMFYKIPLLFIVGVEGMAYFLAAYHVYSFLFVLSATGLPTALSLQISRAVAAGRGRAAGRIFFAALLLFLSLGLSGTLLLFFFAPQIAAHLAMGDAAAAIAAISPALLLAAFSGAVKGFFQGHNRMGPTALGEVLEAAGKLGFGLLFALLARRAGYDTPRVAACAVLGITAGMALSAMALLMALLCFRGERVRGKCDLPPYRQLFSELVRVALPITLGAAMMSAVSLLDTALISARLQTAGFPAEIANAMYSSYGNLAIPLYNLVPSLLAPVTLALMPLLGAAVQQKNRESAGATLTSALRISALFAIPASLGLSFFARPLLELVFYGQSDAIAVAAPLLSVLALSVLPASLVTLTGGALQATGHTLLPVLATGAGALVKLVVESVLLVHPRFLLMGAPVSTLCCTLTVLLIEWIALSRVCPFALSPKNLLRPLLATMPALLLGGALYFLLRLRVGDSVLLMPLVLFVVCAALLFFALGFRAVEKNDLCALPMGEKLCLVLEKYKLIK